MHRKHGNYRILRGVILWLLQLSLLPIPFAFAQTDVLVTQIGPNRTLARNATWTNGPGGLGNNFVFKPSFAYEKIAIYVNLYNDVGPNTLDYDAWVTGDASLTGFKGCSVQCQQSWVDTSQSSTLVVGTGAPTATATITVSGAALVTLTTSQAGSPATDIGSLVIVESQLTASASSGGGIDVNGTPVPPTPNFSTFPPFAGGPDLQVANWTVSTSNIAAWVEVPPVFGGGSTLQGQAQDFFETGTGTIGSGGTLTVTMPTAYPSGTEFSLQCTYNTNGAAAPRSIPLSCTPQTGNTFAVIGDANADIYWLAAPYSPGS